MRQTAPYAASQVSPGQPASPKAIACGLLAAVAVCGILATLARGMASPPLVASVQLVPEPLHSLEGDRPALVLALSAGAATVGAQYPAADGRRIDASYSNTSEYLGYYDAESCYSYNDAPGEKVDAGLQLSDYKRFDRSGPAGTGARRRMCEDGFSGNFLNWASGSALDMLRLALSGGDRLVDTPALTILQRAVIPDSASACVWNHRWFPLKRLQADGGAAQGMRYWGAVPATMAAEARGGDIRIANTLDRIYFGTTKTEGYTGKGAWQSEADGADKADEPGVCDDRDAYRLTGPGRSPPTPGLLNSDGFFYARVKVCDVKAGALQDVRDYGFCTRYPQGNFKPAGVIQKYSDRVRLAAMDYLSTPAGKTGAAVLRVSMKYVGARTFDEAGRDNTADRGNPRAEWAADTGVFSLDPDSTGAAPGASSGVINHLNTLGRVGTVSGQGQYANAGHAGEMHFEALRYLQGLPPASQAAAGGSNDRADPYGEGRSAAADYACLKSSILVIGDAEKGGAGIPRPPAFQASGNIPDWRQWRSVVQAFESGWVLTYPDGMGRLRETSRAGGPQGSDTGGATGSPANDSFLPATAYWANTHDIRGAAWTEHPELQRPGLRVKSFFVESAIPEKSFARSARATVTSPTPFFLASRYGGFATQGRDFADASYNSWGNPFRRDDGEADDLVWQDPLRPGEARTHYRGGNVRELLRAFDRIFNQASTTARSMTGAALSGQTLDAAGLMSYQASFDTADWSGDVVATSISASGTSTVTAARRPAWSAAARLTALAASNAQRNIVIGNSAGSAAVPVATDFTWAAIDASLRQRLDTGHAGSTADGLGEARLAWLRGDRSREGREFRTRRQPLGDIVNSAVVHAGAPLPNAGLDAAYAEFKRAHAGRNRAVYAGANDGMLHAFDAVTGDELFAYIPGWMGSRLAALTAPEYATAHQAYVDGTAAVAEAQTGSAGTAADWKTVLVSGTGAGGPGVFALDVTEPANFSPAHVVWEFTRADDADLGYVTGRPQIVKARTSGPGQPAVYRWFAVVASGVNSHVPDPSFGSLRSTTGQPALFMLALDKPPGTAWTATGPAPNYYKLSVPLDASLATRIAPGLVNFTVTRGAHSELDKIYMGDLHGRLWKLDFSGQAATGWTFASLSAFGSGAAPAKEARPMFIAQAAATAQPGANPQPVSMAPIVLRVPGAGGPGALQIAFATGKHLEPADLASTATQSVYVLHDDASNTLDDSPTAGGAISGRGRLQRGSIHTSTFKVSTAPFTWGRPASDDDKTVRAGWYADLPWPGEKSIMQGLAKNGLWAFQTLAPGAATAPNCAAQTGIARTYYLAYQSGNGEVDASPAFGFPAGLSMIELPPSDQPGAATSTGRRTRLAPYAVWSSGSGGADAGEVRLGAGFAGRLSWRQVSNYRDLKNAP